MQTENNYAETDLGNIAPNPMGDYNSAAEYEYLDLVTMQGGSYLCLAELGQTITGTAPEPGKTTELWQCLAMPGDRTPEYTDAHDKVVRLAKEVAQDAAKVAEDKQSVTQMETNARQLKEQAEESARQAENSKDSAAGSARGAKKAEESARQAESNVRILVDEFDTHVSKKTTEATQAVATAKDNAMQAIGRQETASVQAVKDQTTTYITEQKNLAKQELDKKVEQFGIDVNAIKAEVSEEGQKQITNVQEATTAELAKIAEKGTEQTELVAAEGNKQVQAVQTAAQEIIADREQIQKNKADIASLAQSKADAIISTACGEHVAVGDSSGHLLENLRIFGKSKQVQTTGKNLFSVEMDKTQGTGSTYLYTLKSKPNTKYTLSCDIEKDTIASLYFMKIGTAENGVFKNAPRTITTGEDGTVKIYVRYNKEDGHGINLYQAVLEGEHYIQLEEGETATYPEPYTGGKPSPSPDWHQDIISTGDKGKIDSYITTSNFSSINNIERKETMTSEMIKWSEKKVVYIKGQFKTYDDESYVILSVAYYDKNMKLIGHNGYYRKIGLTYEIEQTSFDGSGANKGNNVDLTKVGYMSFGFRGSDKGTTLNKVFSGADIMVSDKPIPDENYFVPFNKQSLSIPTPNNLYGIQVESGGNYVDETGQQWVCDEIDFKRGKYVKRVEKKTLSYDDNWWLSNKAKYQVFGLTIQNKGNAIGICDKFAQVNSGGKYIGIDTTIKDRIYLITGHETIEELKTWIQSNPITVVYQLSTPTETDIPPEVLDVYKTLHSNYPSTVVQNDSGADMELSYVADTKNYTDNKIKEAVSAQIQNLANLLSLMPLSTQAAMIEADTNNILDNMEVEK